MKKSSVLAVVLCFNSSKFVEECLASLHETHLVDILVVDNKSTDDTAAKLRALQSKYIFKLKCNKANLGYAGGNNIGLRFARKNNYEFAFIVNPDVIVNASAIEQLICSLRANNKIAAVSPLITYADGRTVWYAGAKIHKDIFEPSIEKYRTPLSLVSPRGLRRVDSLIGAAILVDLKCLEVVGLMDEKYFLYCEETDWSLRFKAHGYELACDRDAIMTHDVSSSTGGEGSILQIYYYTRNVLLLCERFAPQRISKEIAYRKRLMFQECKAYIKHPMHTIYLRKALAMNRAIKDYKLHRFGSLVKGNQGSLRSII